MTNNERFQEENENFVNKYDAVFIKTAYSGLKRKRGWITACSCARSRP